MKLLNFLKTKSTSIAGILMALYIILLAITDKLTFYIHPDYKIFATIMGVALLIISVIGLFFYKNHEHKNFTILRTIVVPALFVFIIGAMLKPSALTSNTALRRGIDNDNVNISRSSDEIKLVTSFGQDTRTYDIGTWLKAFSMNPEPTEYEGKKVSVTGFYHKPPELSNDLFYVSRYVLTCCSVDARPVGIYVIDIDKKYKEGDWLKVEGEFIVKNINDRDSVVIKPSNIESTDRPSNPYIY